MYKKYIEYEIDLIIKVFFLKYSYVIFLLKNIIIFNLEIIVNY